MFSLTGIYLIKFVRKNILYQNFVSEKEFDRRATLYFVFWEVGAGDGSI